MTLRDSASVGSLLLAAALTLAACGQPGQVDREAIRSVLQGFARDLSAADSHPDHCVVNPLPSLEGL